MANRFKSYGVAAMALTVGMMAETAWAQDTAATASKATATSEGLAEIIVTAQRRSENLQDVPIAVTAVTAQALENVGVNASNDLPQLVPSVQFTRSGPSGLFFVRGVGTTNAASGEEGANAVYVDNVYMPDLGQTVNRFNNIERIEVLKGPQGTLFGRNATGGLIHVITRDPPRDATVVKGEAGYANYQTATGKLYVGTPLGETAAIDLALTAQDQGKGWGRNLTTGKRVAQNDFWGARSKLLFQPSDAVKVTLSGDYLKNQDDTTLQYGVASESIQTGGYGPTPGYDTYVGDDVGTTNKLYGGSLTGEVDLGFAKLTSISAVRRNDTRSFIDVDATPRGLISLALRSKSKSFQQEVRLASNATTPFNWQIGAFYLHSSARNIQLQRGLAFTALRLTGIDVDATMKTNSIAAFAEATYDITPTTHLTGGVRYTEDRRKFEGGRDSILLSGVRIHQGQPDPKLSYGKFTFRASLRQEFTDDISAYASFNRGFKAGAFSLQAPADPPVAPQFINAYELGLKSELFDRKLRLNLAAYHYDIDDYQVRSTSAASPGSSQLLNAAKVKVDGLEAEFEAAPATFLNLFGGFNLLNARFKSFGGPGAQYQAPIIYPNFATVATTCAPASAGLEDPGRLGSGPRIGGWVACLGDVSGNRTALAPKFAASLGATYSMPVGDVSELRATALYSYNSGYYFDPDNVVRQDSFSQINASIEYKATDKWSVEVWGRNLGDTRFAAQKLTSATGTTATYAPPRTYGVNIKFDY